MQVGFSIDGEWLSDFSRQRVFEGDYQHALSILDCIEGLTIEQKLSILKGEKNLIGTNELNLEKAPNETANKINEDYAWKFGSLLKWDGKYYIPYMIINNWSSLDLPKEESYYSGESQKFTKHFETELYSKMDSMYGGDKLKGFPHSRSMFYSYHPQTDLAYSFNSKDYKDSKYEDGVVLFKEFKEQIPFWVDSYINKHPKDAIKNFLDTGRLFEANGAEFYNENKKDLIQDFLKIDNPFLRGDAFYEIKTDSEEEEAIEDVRNKIKEYASNDKEYGWKVVEDEEGNVLKLPGRAFMHFALQRCLMGVVSGFNADEIKLPPYTPFSKSGLKMRGDDAFHTDCWLGAGLSLESAYDHESWEHKLFMKSVWDMQDTFEERDFNIITKGDKLKFKGIVVNHNNYEDVPKGERVLVIPNLSVDFEQAFFACDYIICETGGKLAHLATLAREFGKPIIRVENATLNFLAKKEIEVNLETGKIEYKREFKKIKP